MSRSPDTILVVDDNEDLCALFASILKADGFQVETCRDADVAIANARSHDYAAIVVETAPTAGFRPLLDYLSAREASSLSRVVVATTDNDAIVDAEWSSKGVFEVLHKPLTRNRLRIAVAKCAAARHRDTDQ